MCTALQRLFALSACCLGLGAPALGQTGATIDREPLAIAVGEGGTEGLIVVQFIVVVEASGLEGPTDLSTDAMVMFDGVQTEIVSLSLTGYPNFGGSGPCGMPCELGDVCYCQEAPGEPPDCSCGPWIGTAEVPLPSETVDEIMVLLRPSPGAAPESDNSNNSLAVAYSGDPLYWNRRLADVQVTPTPGAPDNFFDVWVEIDLGANYDGALRTAVRPILLVNGVPQQTPTCPGACGDTLYWNPCAFCPGENACAADEDGNLYGACSGGCGPPTMCGCCVSGYAQATFVGVPIEPGDEIMVLLRPAPGALPELPGFPDDDERPVPNPHDTCPTDVDNDGDTDADDLVEVILDWGCTDPPGPCPGDVNNDGLVDVNDLTEVILKWGQCDPV